MNIPTEIDWRSEPWDLDIPYAYKHFFGKDLQEAFDLFVDNSLYDQEDIMFMPLPCFRYYVLAYTNYLLSEQSKGDSDGASCFFGLVECRKDDIRSSSEQLVAQIIITLKNLHENQEWYDADENIYGNFKDRSINCLKQIQEAEQVMDANRPQTPQSPGNATR